MAHNPLKPLSSPPASAPTSDLDTVTERAEPLAPENTADRVQGQVSHDAGVPARLVEQMSAGWAAEPPLDTNSLPSAQFCADRRARLSALFPGQYLVVPTGGLKVRANDTDYPFRPGSDFFWLTGCWEPDAVLVMEPTSCGHAATLFQAPRADRSTPAFFTDRRYGELWVGARPGLEETSARLGLAVRALTDLDAELAAAAAGDSAVRVLRGMDSSVDTMIPASSDDDDAKLGEVLSELRLVKDSHEICCLSEAIEATIRGFEDVVRELATAQQERGPGERWLEGTFFRRARTEGNDVGYGSIIATGAHACTLHWVRNDGAVKPGDLLLMDAGVESVELYTADVTRTIPVSGTYSPAQREVYQAVLDAQRAAIAECRPGQPFLAPHAAAMASLTTWLVERGILTCSVDEALDPEIMAYRRYTLHGTSHMLGIDVHDCAQAREEAYRHGDLVEGIVLTVEPGLYFQSDDLTVPEQYRGIGVRIEDDVVITADGHVNLSAAIPTDPDAVEAWMRDAIAGRSAV